METAELQGVSGGYLDEGQVTAHHHPLLSGVVQLASVCLKVTKHGVMR